MALRELLLVLGMDVDKGDEAKVQSALGGIKKAAGAVAAAWAALKTADFLVDIVAGVGEAGNEILNAAEKTGIAAQALQELRFSANEAEISNEQLGAGLRVLSKNAFEAGNGSKEATESFAALGISVRDASGNLKPTEQLFMEASDALRGVEDQTKRVALAQKIFGRSGAELLPLLNQGSEALREQAKAANDLGVVLGQDALDASNRYDKASDELHATINGLTNTFGAELLPTLTDTIKMLAELLKATRPVIKAIGGGLKIAAESLWRVLRGLGQAVAFVYTSLASLGPVIGPLVAIVGILTAAMALFGTTATIAGIQAAIAWIVAFAPVFLAIALLGLIGAAIWLVIDDLVAMGDGGDSVIGTLIDGFNQWVDELGGVGAAVREIFFVAFNDIFGMSRSTFEEMANIIENIFTTLGELFYAPFVYWADKVGALVDSVAEKFATVGKFVGGIFGGSAAANVAGASAASTAANSDNRSTVIAPRTQVQVTVDASGNAQPSAVGNATGSAIAGSQEFMNRQLINAHGVAMATP